MDIAKLRVNTLNFIEFEFILTLYKFRVRFKSIGSIVEIYVVARDRATSVATRVDVAVVPPEKKVRLL